jgi:hypothetical protein
LSASSYCLYVVWPLATLLVSLHRCTAPMLTADYTQGVRI